MVTREGFDTVVDNAFAGLGFPAEASKFVYPLNMFLPSSDLSPIRRNIQKVIDGLTKWEPKVKKKGVVVPPMITVAGNDYAEALSKMNLLFLRNLWSDGLPLMPATGERVNWILSGTDFPREKVIGKILPKGRIATMEVIATAAAMAGCRPEYMPVLIAAMEGILDPQVYHQHMNTTTGNAYPAVIVNGPIARQVRLNSGYGCLGPSSVYPAGASIGRAIRLLLMDVGGAIPGAGTMAIHGGPARYTGLVFAEDEAGLPKDWKPLNVERGFPPNSNTVTVLAVSGTTEIWEGAALDEVEAKFSLDNFAGVMSVPYGGYFGPVYNPEGAPGILLIARAAAQGFSNLGWTKEKIKTYLWENSKLPESEWLKDRLLGKTGWVRRESPVKDYVKYPMPITVAPENFMIAVAGGEQSGHSYWLQVHGGTIGPTTKQIQVPANWGKLLQKAEEDLGSLPTF